MIDKEVEVKKSHKWEHYIIEFPKGKFNHFLDKKDMMRFIKEKKLKVIVAHEIISNKILKLNDDC